MGYRQVVDEATIEIELYEIDDTSVTHRASTSPGVRPNDGGGVPGRHWLRRMWSRALAPPLRTDGVSTVRRVVVGEFSHTSSALEDALVAAGNRRVADASDQRWCSTPSVEAPTGWMAVTGDPRRETVRCEVRVPAVLRARYGMFGVRTELVIGEWSSTRSELRLEVSGWRRGRGRLPRGYFGAAHDVLDRVRDEIELRLT